MRSLTCVSVVACVARKLRPCPSYSRRRDRINLGLWRSLYKGGGGTEFWVRQKRMLWMLCLTHPFSAARHQWHVMMSGRDIPHQPEPPNI